MHEILKQLGPADQMALAQLRRLYKAVDKETERFAHLTGIRCPQLCGVCCRSAKVEATVFEMLPLAIALWSTREGLSWLKEFEKNKKKRCLFFRPDPHRKRNGRCGVYPYRPLICRLFGFSVNKDKQNTYAYGGCKTMKTVYPKSFTRAQEIIKKKRKFITMSDFATHAAGIGIGHEQKAYPINTAARLALEKIGFELEKYQWKCKI